MYRISVYGKGGVGKSSLSSNLSYLLSARGKKILHVGCDPKHDSTRLLTNGVSQRTYMDFISDGNEEGVIEQGSNGIGCVECGGAEPGIGCAGKGMISLFQYVGKHTPEDTDVRVCDVLGDVVCGGFSVPMRKDEVDGLIIVVSEDFMSLYAANNILRGVKNLNGTPCIMGMVVNSRAPEDRIRVDEFSKATGIRVLATVNRSPAFSRAEGLGKTVSEAFPDGKETKELNALADAVTEVMEGRLPLQCARPLSDKAMTQIAAGVPVTDLSEPPSRTQCRFDHYDSERNISYKGDFVMPVCTSHGAVEVLLAVRDAAIVLHGPRNCAFLMEYAWRRRGVMMEPGKGSLLPCNLYSTEMDGKTTFRGDREILKDTVRKAVEDGFKTVFVVFTCTPETIGTDMNGVLEELDLDADIIPVPADEKFLSSKFGGYGGAVKAMASLMDWSVPVDDSAVALFSFEPNYLAHRSNREFYDELFGAFGLKLKVIFMDDLTTDDIRSVPSCRYFIQMGEGNFSRKISDIVVAGRREVQVAQRLPIGITELREWAEMLGKMTGNMQAAADYMSRKTDEYLQRITPFRKVLEGKTAVIYTRPKMPIDTEIDLLEELGVEVKCRINWQSNFEDHQKWTYRHPDIREISDVPFCEAREVIGKEGADLLISGDPRTGRLGIQWISLAASCLGTDWAVEVATKIVNSLKIRPQQGWKEAA